MFLVAAVAPASAAGDVSGTDIVRFVNAQRAAHGLPAAIAEDPTRSSGCAQHTAYEAATGALTRTQDPAHPLASPAGADAARSALLYGPGYGPWTAQHNPFELAPVHLHQLLAPRIDRLGAAEVDGYGCVTALASRARPAPPADVTYTYPGDGVTGWPPDQVAREAPATPGQLAGLGEGDRTGPYLYVSFDGPDLTPAARADAVSATVTGPDGGVDVVVVDNGTPGLEGYLPTGMQVIPREPLAPLTAYRATVVADVTAAGGGATRRFSRTWTFTTGLRTNDVVLAQATVVDGRATVVATSDAPGATVTATGPGTAAEAPLGPAGAAQLDLDDHGFWTVCVRSGGGASGFHAGEACADVGVPRAGRDHLVAVPRSAPRRAPFDIRIATEDPIEMAYRVLTRRGVVVARGGRRPLAPGTYALPVQVARGYATRGRRLQVRIVLFSGGRATLVKRRVRLR